MKIEMSKDKGCKGCCSASSGIHGGLTFGRGDLDFNGYWEFPCELCARKAEKRR